MSPLIWPEAERQKRCFGRASRERNSAQEIFSPWILPAVCASTRERDDRTLCLFVAANGSIYGFVLWRSQDLSYFLVENPRRGTFSREKRSTEGQILYKTHDV